MYSQLQRKIIAQVREYLQRQYEIDLPNVIVEAPPKVEFGEYALPFAFELARRLRKAPRKIAEEIVAGMGPIDGVEKLEVAGAGYINVRVSRGAMAGDIARGATSSRPVEHKVLVEHTSINPNKAAHIGHLRNAILGDTFVRLLRASGARVDVQNYIDNTGVQVADVVVGLVYLEGKSRAEVEELIATQSRFDYYCWDLYARVSHWYDEAAENKAKRLETLHAIEKDDGDVARIAEMVSVAVLRRHLQTMLRLGIEYDFLPRESEILSLKFWEAAFEQMKSKGVLYFETEGKNNGCWVMLRPSAIGKPKAEITDEDMKVIVRSNGTVGYVGKDIAYHLWKFGLLGKDFQYRRFFKYPDGRNIWISTHDRGEEGAPHFGGVGAIYNVIDARQSEPQNTVIEALRALGHSDQAANYTHFSYEMVALTPRCAQELGYTLSEDEWGKNYIEVSGRKGFGVKADDLLDKLTASALKEVESRHPEMSGSDRRSIAQKIAVGALRYFMLKFTKNSVIAFDFKEALSFEGETGPYAQYAAVRAGKIFEKAGTTPEAALAEVGDISAFVSGEENNALWELWLAASKTSHIIDSCIATTEPAFVAKHAFYLAQLFNNFYHKHHILTETDAERKRFLLATAAVARRELIRVLRVMGIEVPPAM